MRRSILRRLFEERFFILAKVPVCLALELRAGWAERYSGFPAVAHRRRGSGEGQRTLSGEPINAAGPGR